MSCAAGASPATLAMTGFELLEDHPDVAMAAVVGTKDAVYSEVGAAFVVCEPGRSVDADSLKEWCKERLAGYKVPKTFHVRSELPLLPIGKVDKQALKRELD